MIPSKRQTVLDYLDDYARRGRSVAISQRRGLRTVRISYEELAREANRFARELQRRGIRSGERVLLIGENSPEWVIAFYGCMLHAVVAVPLDKESAPEFTRVVQTQTNPRLVIAGDDVLDAQFPNTPIIRLEDLRNQIASHSAARYPHDEVDQESLVEIIFTSGTTSQPKGVLLTHKNLLANLVPLETEIKKYIKWERFVHPIRFLSLVPLSHIFGQFMGVFVPQLIGGEVHFQGSLNPGEIVRATTKKRISVIVLVPRMLETLRDWVERDYTARGGGEELRRRFTAAEGTSALRRWWIFRRIHGLFGWKFWAFISGGATLNEGTENFWQSLGFAVLQGYGMTESASLISVNHPFKQSRGSIGKIMPGYELKLDEDGQILVRGESVSSGYWAEDAGIGARSDDWLHTGDIGAIDSEGNLFFKGRKKDVIVTAAGLNIYPEDLEAALSREPEIRSACVIATPTGTEPLAVIILRDPKSSAEAAINRANKELAEYQRIRRWHIWRDIDFPRTATQKVIKREVAAAVERAGSEPSCTDASTELKLDELISPPYGFVLSQVARTTDSSSGLSPVVPDASLKLSDLRLDSLGRVELLSALEDRYQIEIDEAAFTAATTVADVEKIVRGTIEEAAAAYPYPKWPRSLVIRSMRAFLFYSMVMPLTRLMSRMRVEGATSLERVAGPALFVANHVTLADHALILVGLPARLRRRLAIAMEGELLRDWRYPPVGTGLFTRFRQRAQYVLINLFFQVFPLPKKSGFRRSFGYAGECVDRGESVLVFPEGLRAPRGQMQMSGFKMGTGLLAKELKVPVVPVKLDGLYELKQRKQYFAPPGHVRVIFGEPLSFSSKASPAEITHQLQQLIAALGNSVDSATADEAAGPGA